MTDKRYALDAWYATEKLLNIDSPTGFCVSAAAWVKEAFEALGYGVKMTQKRQFNY